MTRGQAMTGPCRGCATDKLYARNLCNRCYDYALSSARRQGLLLGEYVETVEDLASPGRHNARPHKHNRSGHRGCSFDRGKWRATIHYQGRSFHLGRFIHLEQAQEAYAAAQMRVRAGLPPAPPSGPSPEQASSRASNGGPLVVGRQPL